MPATKYVECFVTKNFKKTTLKYKQLSIYTLKITLQIDYKLYINISDANMRL